MTSKNKATVIAIKLKDGNNILGWYCGESDSEEYNPYVVLYRPIYIKAYSHFVGEKQITHYGTSSYFQYGSQMVSIPNSEIMCRDIASEFFSLFYAQSIGDIIATEDDVADSYLKFFEKRNTKEAMENTDSILVTHTTEFMQ